jgi:hypothetical protein
MPPLLTILISGLLSLGIGQSAYLTALVTPSQPTSTAPALTLRGRGSCDIVLSFFDGQSNLLKTNEVWIDPGSSAALKFDLDDLKGKSRGRGPEMIYATLTLNSDPSVCPLIGTLDITDVLGRTTALLPLGRGLAAFGTAN